MRYRVTIRSHNYVGADIDAPAGAPEEVLRHRIFEMIEDGKLEWHTDYADTEVLNLGPGLDTTGAVD